MKADQAILSFWRRQHWLWSALRAFDVRSCNWGGRHVMHGSPICSNAVLLL